MDYDAYLEDCEKCSYGFYGHEDEFDKIGEILSVEDIKHLMDIRLHVRYDEDDYNLKINEQNGLFYTDQLHVFSGETLINHMLVEKCMEDPDKIDWQLTTRNYDYDNVAFIRELYENPLTWIAPEEKLDILYIGPCVKEQRDDYRPYMLNEFWQDFYNKGLLWFADNLPVVRDGRTLFRYDAEPDDFIAWDRLVSTKCTLLQRATQRVRDTLTSRIFDFETFRNNINYIAQHRGERRAAEIVRLLQKDWKDIVLFGYFRVNMIPQEDIEQFQSYLFEGMERYLQNWETEDDADATSDAPKAVPTCRYIDLDQLASTGIHTPEQFTTMLRQACEQDAPSLAVFLRKYIKLGYLDFHGEKMTRIYKHLKECFPGAIKYSYTNFTMYFT